MPAFVLTNKGRGTYLPPPLWGRVGWGGGFRASPASREMKPKEGLGACYAAFFEAMHPRDNASTNACATSEEAVTEAHATQAETDAVTSGFEGSSRKRGRTGKPIPH
jgi:hypothetical protein